MKIMVSVNKSKVPWDELMEQSRKTAPFINEAQGDSMEWKIWIENKEEGLIGGVYYFENEEEFRKRMVEGKSKDHLPTLIENIYSQVFDVNVDLSRINKAPI
jgi:hypothetical protein